MIELRLRTKLSDNAVRDLAGKVLGRADHDVLLTGRTFVRMPDGRPLACYLPGALSEFTSTETYEILHSLNSLKTSNRGMASGTKRVARGTGEAVSSRTESRPIASAVVGSIDPMGQTLYCRLTSWTGKNLPQWQKLHPLLQEIARNFAQHVPDRYAKQKAHANATVAEWVVPGTPFTTVTVNNSYPTGVHTDKGDLDEGFSTIACLRRGNYRGGTLIFPQFRVGVDMRDGDLLLMDAHQWHGNIPLTCQCGTRMNGPCKTCSAERISIVSYFRTKMTACGTPEQESTKAVMRAEQRSGLHVGEPA